MITACGAGSTYTGGVYADAEVRFHLDEPGNGWHRVDVEDANDLAWFHDGLDSIIQVNASCNPRLDIPLAALTNHLMIGFTDREVVEEQIQPFDGREALRTHVRARLDGVVREMTLVVTKKDQCVYDFALVAPPRSYAQASATFDPIVTSFATR